MAFVRETWERIIRWHREHATDDGGPSDVALPAPATETAVGAAERAIGLPFPADLRASYLLHDGSAGDGVFPWGDRFLSAAEVARAWQWNQERLGRLGRVTHPGGPIRTVFWDAGWIPFGANGSGDSDGIDLRPASGGSVGQVIRFSHEVGPTRVASASFGAWRARYADRREAGLDRYDADSLWVGSADREE